MTKEYRITWKTYEGLAYSEVSASLNPDDPLTDDPLSIQVSKGPAKGTRITVRKEVSGSRYFLQLPIKQWRKIVELGEEALQRLDSLSS